LTVVTDEDVVGRVATVGFPTIYQGAATLRTSRTNRFTYTVAGMIDHVDTVDSSGTLRTTYYKYDDARRQLCQPRTSIPRVFQVQFVQPPHQSGILRSFLFRKVIPSTATGSQQLALTPHAQGLVVLHQAVTDSYKPS
jgi:hypothetical protein